MQFSIFSLTVAASQYIIFVVNIMSIENYCKFNYDFLYFEEIDSTNTYAKEIAKNGACEGTVVIADKQTAGKGRLGRTFFSLLDGIYLSVVLFVRYTYTIILVDIIFNIYFVCHSLTIYHVN